MKIQSIINLIRCHMDNNDAGFRSEVSKIANDFDIEGKNEIASYLMELISTTNYYRPQNNVNSLAFLKKCDVDNASLYLPQSIQNDILGIVRSRAKSIPISKVLFYGKPGSGKTQSAFQIARLLDKELLLVKTEELIDSRLGQTSKNVLALFDEIRHLASMDVVILFDEIDGLVMNRLSNNDLREMGRVTSTFLKELESLPDKVLFIATTNLADSLDKALLRRFDARISFDRYSKDDLIQVSDSLLSGLLKRTESKSDMRLFNKILRNAERLPYPGEMKQILKIAIAFSDDSSEYDYLKRIYEELHNGAPISIEKLSKEGFTTREIETLTGISKSSVSRIQKGQE